MDFGNKIKKLMDSNDINITDLAKIIDVNRVFLSRIVNNHQKPSFDTLSKICDALGVTLSEFFSIDEEDSDSLPPEYIELVKNAKNLSPKQLKILNDFIKNF